jgi:NADH:ubiquinone reductase (H+-translocating)
MPLNIPDAGYKRVVIIGGGFAGLELARQLSNTVYQVVLIDKNNYHQFQPLLYQVSMAGLEPSSIVFPFRKIFQKVNNVIFRVAELQEVLAAEKNIMTDQGKIKYDFLILALGADTNYFGNQQIMDNAIPMKSVAEALYLRNAILGDYEKALLENDVETREALMDIVIVGGGPTGVEVAGALAEMRNDVLPREYKELNHRDIDIYLLQGSDRLLNTMSEQASAAAERFLLKMGVKVRKNTAVTNYDGTTVTMRDGSTLRSKKVIWAAGIVANPVNGLPESVVTFGKRLKTNVFNQIEGYSNIFALGDMAYMTTEKFEKGHPQVAQVALQQAKNLAHNLMQMAKGKPELRPFTYRDLGSMATVGRNKAVVDLPFWRFQGAFAWFVWLFVHLFAIIGTKNRLFIFLNWVWSYFTYDQALRLIIKPRVKNRMN